jgi:hypothetical protein
VISGTLQNFHFSVLSDHFDFPVYILEEEQNIPLVVLGQDWLYNYQRKYVKPRKHSRSSVKSRSKPSMPRVRKPKVEKGIHLCEETALIGLEEESIFNTENNENLENTLIQEESLIDRDEPLMQEELLIDLSEPDEPVAHSQPLISFEILSLDSEMFQQEFNNSMSEKLDEKINNDKLFEEIIQLYQEVMDENKEEPAQHTSEKSVHALTDEEIEQLHSWTIERKDLASILLQQQVHEEDIIDNDWKEVIPEDPTLKTDAFSEEEMEFLCSLYENREESVKIAHLQQQIHVNQCIDSDLRKLLNFSFPLMNNPPIQMHESTNVEYQWKKRKKYKNQKIECDVTAPQNLISY